MRSSLAGLLLLGMILLLAGCAEKATSTFLGEATTKEKAPAGREPANGPRQVPEAALPRKIIYTGRVELVVEEFDAAQEQLLHLLEAHKGYVARSEITGRPGEPRHGQWTLRIPVAQFDDFRQALGKIGELRRSTLDSEDITDRYFDMTAEVTNLESREKALRKLYDDKIAGSKLSDLLDVDRELTTVRGQINLRKGQLQRWDKETALATLNLDMQDRKSYVPPASPDFGTTIGRTFQQSIELMLRTGKGIVLVAVALAPWLGVALVPLAVLWLLTHRRRPVPPPPPVIPPGDKSPA
ncbi:MAG: DUF4349 domain-containing protein [Gemmataceae bacterium]